MTRSSSAVAVIADRTAYNAWYSYRPVLLNNRAQQEYLLIYSFERKSIFDAEKSAVDASQLFHRLWLNDCDLFVLPALAVW